MSDYKGWIGVDLDGTLAEYDGWKGVEHIGAPVPLMMNRVMSWLADDQEVRIFTARVSRDGTPEGDLARKTICDWCLKHLGRVLPITNVKDMAMIELWDDRAIRVELNTGKVL